MSDSYTLGSHTFRSRLIVGSGKYPSLAVQLAATEASGADMVTVALRRVDPKAPPEQNVLAPPARGRDHPAEHGAAATGSRTPSRRRSSGASSSATRS